ncbi:MAG: hypothetical protein EPO07_04500 [Verrucomicrobia bacterium]|nr:MAG: hypothetical protein EPO07_04500 [Verrucomicrobiota bacterium]
MKSPIKPKKVTRKAAAATTVVAPVKPATVEIAQPVSLKPARATQTKTNGKTVKPKATETTIEAKIDVGFGNQLYVRGQGAGLSWERGTPLTCVDGSTWRWTALAEEKLVCKLLLNDQVWASGEDLVVAPGKRVEITPAF